MSNENDETVLDGNRDALHAINATLIEIRNVLAQIPPAVNALAVEISKLRKTTAEASSYYNNGY